MEGTTMGGVMLSASTCLLNSVMEKLTVLMGEEYEKHTTLHKEAGFLKDELGSMNALLKKLALMEVLDPQAKEWRDQVMDMTFDIEDFIDDFMRQVREGDKNGNDVGFIRMLSQFVNAVRMRYQFANQIQALKTRVIEVNERRKRYKLDECASISSHVSVDCRIPALYTEAENLVGMDGPRDEIIKLLADERPASGQKLRVVSIVGFGGLGKTTLANEVYLNLGRQFEYKAFLSVSQRPDFMKLLGKIMSKVNIPHPLGTYYLPDLIDSIRSIREYLHDKRYLFVIDDLWDQSAWKTLRCAFPNNHLGSVLIITTRIGAVAQSCCCYNTKYIYNMKPLDDRNSRKLFFNRIGYSSCQDFNAVSHEILQKCGGLPLAIISIASLLASQPARSMEQWKYVCSSLKSSLKTDPTLEGLRQVLKLSYSNLPQHLKLCLLYIGIYPEDYYFTKINLVRKWVAEGFIPTINDRDIEEVSKSYFNELVNRSMIQPAEICSLSGEVLLYKVHDMILDLIKIMSEEENFYTVINNRIGMHAKLQCKVRRISLQIDDPNDDIVLPKTGLSHVRSLSSFLKSNILLPISELRYLRVLCVEHWSNCEHDVIDLTHICKLFQLRYLKISFNAIIQMPTQIGDLRYLDTLDLDGQITGLPTDIIHLPCLLHLFVPPRTRLPNGLGNIKSLRSLWYFNLGLNSVDNLKGLGELTDLQDLQLCGYTDGLVRHQRYLGVLWSSISKIANCNLRSLRIEPFLSPPIPSDELYSQIISPRHLERLEAVNWQFPRLPRWTSQLHELSILQIGVKELKKDDIYTLATLPALAYLWLWTKKGPKQNILIPCKAFPALRCLIFSCFELCLTFEAGAMPNLRSLSLGFHSQGVGLYGRTLYGIEHLPNLDEVIAYIYCGRARESYRTFAKAALRRAIVVHPGLPFLSIYNADECEYGLEHVFNNDDTDDQQVDNNNSNVEG